MTDPTAPPRQGEWDAAVSGHPPLPPPRMEQRSAVLLLAGFVVVLLAALIGMIPVPYAVFSPGPVLNTLGTVDGKKLISVSGRQTYPTTGQLDMTTVSLRGGPGNPVSLRTAILSWLDPGRAVVPEATVFVPGQTREQSEAEDQALMVSSQESATAAALGALDIPVPTSLAVDDVEDGAPADGVLQKGDVLLAVDGQRIPDLTELRALLQKVPAGGDVDLRIRRGDATQDVTTGTIPGEDGRTLLGVYLDPTFEFPFQVRIEIEDVVGPSAGMMFALGIVDTLTPGDLTGGERIAGTGTIDADGSVGPIGGIQQKLIGARDAGADWFLAPIGNCDEVRGHVPDGLRVVRVETLTQARTSVEAIAAERTGQLPTC